MTVAPLDLLDLDTVLTDEERDIRALCRRVADDRVRPFVADWFEQGDAPIRDLALEFGKLGLTAIGNSREEADALYFKTLEVLDRETAYGRLRTAD